MKTASLRAEAGRAIFAAALLLTMFGFTGAAASAESADAHHASGIPFEVWLQFINFGLYAALIFFVARKPVREHFTNKARNYAEALKKAETAKAEAERKRGEIQARLTKLESTREQSIQQARAEAAQLKEQIVREAKDLSAKLRADAERTAETELFRAKQALRQDLLTQSVAMARKTLADKMQDQDQKRLQSEFVEKIQVVSQ